MRANRHPFPTGLIALGMLIAIPVSVAAQGLQSGAPVASEQLGGTTLTVVPHVPYQTATLRVAGPGGYALTKGFDGATSITVDLQTDAEPARGDDQNAAVSEAEADRAAPARLPDGVYHYEVVLIGPIGERTAHSGMFFVEGGSAASLGAMSARLGPSGDDGLVTDAGSQAEGPATPNFNVDDLLQVLDTGDDQMTHIFLQSDTSTTPPSNWHIRNDFGAIRFREFFGGGDSDRLALVGANVGIGTTAPQRPLHIAASSFNQARLQSSTTANRFDLDVGSVGLWFWDREDQPIVKLNHSAPSEALVVDGAGLGVGTNSPVADIDVGDLDGSTITNIRFAVGGSAWTNAVTSSTGNFIFNRQGTGGPEFAVTTRNNPSATLVVNGHVQGTSFKSSSSRALKTAFEAIEPLEVLASLATMPVTAWRYKTEGEQVRHVGPVAEDFQRLFGLGDGKTIASVDADGVLMAAVQGLYKKMEAALEAKDAEIVEVRDRNAELEARLAAVEARLGTSTP